MANTLGDIVVNLTLNTRQFTQSMQQISNNISNATRQIGRSTDALSTTVQDGTNDINDSLGSVLSSSRVLARTLGTTFEDQRRVLGAAGREFHTFANIGRRVPMDIAEQFSALPRHLQQYVSRLRDAGQDLSAFARLNQQYSQRRIAQMQAVNDYLQNKTTQSARLMQSFANDTRLAPLTNGFLHLGDQMERTAARGTVLSVALGRIGPTATLHDLQTQMRFVQQGIMRARGSFLVFGAASLLAFIGMGKLAASVDKRVIPAFDKMKDSWLGAMMPFIKTFADGMIHVMNFITAIGEMVGAFSKAHPVIFKIVMSIAMLTLVLGALLSPLAVTGIWAEGVAASFSALWMIIGPFVLGFLAVIGVAIALATALVVLYVSIKMMWKQSEVFRNAFINLWAGIKDAFNKMFLAPILSAWNNLKQAFGVLVATITGGQGTSVGGFFKWLGDIIGTVVNVVAKVLMPIFQLAFQIAGQIIGGVINTIAWIIGWLASAIAGHSGTIMKVIGIAWGYIVLAFTTIGAFITSIMPSVTQTISMAFALIRDIIVKVVTFLAPIVVGAFKVIAAIMTVIWPVILTLIKLTWENIKGVITSTIAIIQGIIKLFSAILQGDWGAAWEAVKSICANAFKLIWNLVSLWLIGKVVKLVVVFCETFGGLILRGLNAVWKLFSTILTRVGSVVSKIFNGIITFIRWYCTTMQTLIAAGFGAVYDKISGAIGKAYDWVKSKFSSMKQL
jgi:hypothetical protein